MDMLTFAKDIESIVARYNDLIGGESEGLREEYAIPSVDKLNEGLSTIANKDRLLQVGIIGRVKAGKSSLLNALFFDGKPILPKAATPMTAALCVMTYGEKLSAKVDFFTKKDISNIKQKHDEYERVLEALIQKYFDESKSRKIKNIIKKNDDTNLREKAKRKAARELKENIGLLSSYDQYERIQRSGIDPAAVGENTILNASSFGDLSEKLLSHVGANGAYMPFTKSVHIKIPQENLKNIQIVDTPGVNDPVQSREERTRELLKFCDVVFIVSPSGQFLSFEDVDLMDRITSKEGIRRLHVVASQVDLQLFGSVKEDNGGDLRRALNSIVSDLASHLQGTISKLKETNPEVGSAYDQLLEQSKEKVIYSSGICQTICNDFDNKKGWDEGTKKAWENLTFHYPDCFSNTDETLSKSNLKLLANISVVNEIIEDVKEQKEGIIQKRKKDYVKAKSDSLIRYKKELLEYIKKQVELVNDGDIKDLKEKQQNLKMIKAKTSISLNEEYYDLVKELEINIKDKLNINIGKYFRETRGSVNDAEGSESRSYTTGWWLWKKTHHYDVVTVRTGAVRSALQDLTNDVEDSVANESIEIVQKWKKNLYSQLVGLLRRDINDEDLDVVQIKKAIREVLNSVVSPSVTYSGALPNDLSAKGTLTGSSAEDYLETAKGYIVNLHRRVKQDINSYLSSLVSPLNALDLSKGVFASYSKTLSDLENMINNKGVTLARLKKLKNELERIG